MKICILTHTFPKHYNDTTAAFMHPLILGLLEMGHNVIVLTPYTPHLRTSDFPYRIITYKYIWPKRFHRLGYSQTLSQGGSFKFETYILAPFLYLFGFIALLRLLQKDKFHIVSAHWILPNGFLIFLVSLLVKVSYTVTLAGSDVYIANKNSLFSIMARLAAENSSAILSDSPQYLKELQKTGATIKERYIIPYPVDTSKINIKRRDLISLRRELLIKSDTVVILAVGRLVQKKGFKYLIQATHLVLKRQKNVLLIIVGDGDLRDQLKSLAKKLKILEYVKFVGNVGRNKIFCYYNLADIFIMPSIVDSQGNIDDRPVALLEAIACGKPVIATNFPGNALSIKDQISGLLISQKNVNAMSNAIIQLIESDELRKSMSMQAKKIAREQFDMVQVGKKYTAIFRSVIKHK